MAELSIVIRAQNEASAVLDGLDSQIKVLGTSLQDVAHAGNGMLEIVSMIGHAVSETNLTMGIDLLDDVLGPARKLKIDLQQLFESEITQKIVLSDEAFGSAKKLREELRWPFDITQVISLAGGDLGDGIDMEPQFGESDNLPSYASGINFVPRDMVARIHQGETVLNKQDAERYRNGGNTVTIGDIIINTQPGQDVGRETIMRLRNELARLDRRLQ